MCESTPRAPRYRTLHWSVAAILASGAIACSPSTEKESAAAAAAPPHDSVSSHPSPAAGAASATGCRMEGEWTPCAIEERLVRAGVVIEKQPATASYPFFSVPGVSYNVGSAEHQLLVFVYPSASARAHDTALLDSATVSPRGTRVTWPAPPTLVVSNNLAAVIVSLNDRTVERLALALSAGLPKPEKR
jgi:hypothetical protein